MILLILMTTGIPKTPSMDGYSSSWNTCIANGWKSSMKRIASDQHPVSRQMVLTKRRGND